METNQQRVDRLQAELDALLGQSPRNETAVSQTASALEEAKRELEQEQAARVQIQQDHEERVTKVTDDIFAKLDNLEVSNGLKLRDVTIDESLYQSAIISIKGLVQAEIDDLSKLIAKLQTENAEINALFQKANSDLQITAAALNKEKLDHTYTQQARDNAAALVKEANECITDLQEQLKAATAGVKTINTEDEQRRKAENDARIKLTRTIYNRVADNELFPKMYTANLAATGEPITFPSFAVNSYIVIKESEVSQFRQDNGIAEAAVTDTDSTPVESVDETVQDGLELEESFPEVPTVEVPNIPAADTVVGGAPESSGEGRTLEEAFRRIEELERSVYGKNAEKEVA